MKALLLHPEFSAMGFWNYKDVCRLMGAKYPASPLGLITMAALLPPDWDLRLIDLNTARLRDADIDWADLVFIGGMLPQQAQFLRLVERAHARGKRVVAGGPDPTSQPDLYCSADYLVLGEAEGSLPLFLADLAGGAASGTYSASERPDLTRSPIPRFDLLNFSDYLMIGIQFSRGCPFNCEFCDIIELYGRRPRTKTDQQIIAEVDALYRLGHRGHVDFVDDNFIGAKSRAKQILRVVKEWSAEHRHPFFFSTETSINVADDDELLALMQELDFRYIFVGFETVDDDVLRAAKKPQNIGRDVIADLHKIYRHGIVVNGGFIVGFDRETSQSARRMIELIEKGRVVIPMIGLLYAVPGTQLERRLHQEGRLALQAVRQGVEAVEIDQTTCGINFVPDRPHAEILSDFLCVLTASFSPKNYFDRCLALSRALCPGVPPDHSAVGLSPFDCLLLLAKPRRHRRHAAAHLRDRCRTDGALRSFPSTGPLRDRSDDEEDRGVEPAIEGGRRSRQFRRSRSIRVSPSCDLVVVGAGAAGLAAAIFALRRRSAARVLVVDGASKLGAKILVSGGGRCNVTNVEVGERDFNGAPRTFIRRVLKAFPAGRTRAFFEEIGVPLTEEPAGKLFPVSNRAGDVLRALLEEAAGRGTDIRSGVRVKGIRRTDRGFEITTNVDKIETRSVVLATGGLALPRSGSDGAGYDLARALGHTLVPPTPALVPLLLEGSFHRDLSGVTHDVGIEVRVGGRRYASTRGSMLWTHFGVSGPAVLDASRFWHRASLESSEVSVVANLLPGCDLAAAEARLAEAMGSSGARALRNVLSTLLPARLAGSVLAVLEIDPDTRAAHLSRTLRRQLLAAILEWPLPVVGSRGYDHAEATAGGIPLEEVDSATMESRICPGLHFAGEILDVDGRLGGFNFQWAWSSGFVGGSAAVAA